MKNLHPATPAPCAIAASRRAFLGACGSLATALATFTSAASPSQPTGWRIAIGLNGFQSGAHKYKKNYPIWEIAHFGAKEGFDGVELVGNWPMGAYPGAGETDRAAALKRFWNAFGMQIFSIQLDAGGASHADPAERKRWLEQTSDRIKLARQLGCSCIGMWPSGSLAGRSIDEAIEILGGSFRKVAGVAEDYGILAAFEIEPPFAFNSESHLEQILAAADHPNLKTIYDPSHFDLMSGSTGKPHAMLERIGVKNIGYVHFTDCDGTLRDGGTSKHLAAGDGHIDLPASLRMLRDGGFRGWIMIDEWEIPDPYDACTKGMNAIRTAW